MSLGESVMTYSSSSLLRVTYEVIHLVYSDSKDLNIYFFQLSLDSNPAPFDREPSSLTTRPGINVIILQSLIFGRQKRVGRLFLASPSSFFPWTKSRLIERISC